MEEATIALEAELSAGVWTDIMSDVLLGAAPLHLEGGIKGVGPLDLVAGVGVLRCVLDNGESNTAKKRGYYSPGHADERTGFDEGIQIRPKFTYGGTPYYKWVGRISSIKPTPGMFAARRTNLQAVDWMDQAANQKIAQLAIQTSKRVDQALPTALAGMPIQPRATSYGTGIETFGTVFDTDQDEKESFMALCVKLARNEMGGLIYLKGDTAGGETFRFDSRHTRPLNQTSIGTLDNLMDDIEVEYDRKNVKNIVHTKIYPKRIDAAATTVIYENQVPFSIAAGQSITIICAYRDPATSRPISASDVVNPLVADTHFKFGVSSGSDNTLNALLGIVLTIGGNTTKAVLTNNAAVTGYVNIFKLLGKGIYPYDPQTLESKDAASVLARGPLELPVEMEQHDNPNKGQAWADYLRLRGSLPVKIPRKVSYVANKSAALMGMFLQGEVSSRFTLKEYMNAYNGDCFINGVAADVYPGGLIKVEWTVIPADVSETWIIDTDLLQVGTYLAL